MADACLNFFSGNFTFEINQVCLEEQGINVLEECHITFAPNGSVSSYGSNGFGQIPPNPDIGGKGVRIGFSATGVCLLFMTVLSLGAELSRVCRRTKRHHSNLAVFSLARNFESAHQRRWVGMLRVMLIKTADSQIILALGYGISFALESKCRLTAYHYDLAVHTVLVACAAVSMSVLLIRDYWARSPAAALLRSVGAVVVFAFLGRMLVYTSMLDAAPDYTAWGKGDQRRDSSLFLLQSCFLDKDLNPLKYLTRDQLATVGGHADLGSGSKWRAMKPETILYSFVGVVYGLSHLTHLFRHFWPTSRQGKHRRYRHRHDNEEHTRRGGGHACFVLLGYLLAILFVMCVYAYCYFHTSRVSAWAQGTGWLLSGPGVLGERSLRSFGQMQPVVSIAWVLAGVLDEADWLGHGPAFSQDDVQAHDERHGPVGGGPAVVVAVGGKGW